MESTGTCASNSETSHLYYSENWGDVNNLKFCMTNDSSKSASCYFAPVKRILIGLVSFLNKVGPTFSPFGLSEEFLLLLILDLFFRDSWR